MATVETLRKIFNERIAIVTGGTGMIGREIVNILCDAGAKVRSISLDNLKINPSAEYVYGDLSDFSFCKEITPVSYTHLTLPTNREV